MKNRYKKVYSLSHQAGYRNYTVKDLRDQKGQKVLVETAIFSPEEAIAAEQAGIDTIKVRFDPARPDLVAAIRKAAPNTFMAFSVPLSSKQRGKASALTTSDFTIYNFSIYFFF